MALLLLFLSLLLSPVAQGRALDGIDNSRGLKYNEKICEACEIISAELSTYLNDSDASSTSIDILESTLCAKLSGNLLEECKLLVEAYVPEVMSALESTLATGDLCAKQSFCDYQVPSVKKSSSDGVKCSMCKVAAQEVLTMLENNETQTRVLSTLHSVCSKIRGGAVANTCTTLVDAYFLNAVDIASSMTPSQLCTFAGYCSLARNFLKMTNFHPSFSSRKGFFASEFSKQPGDCFACKMMVAYFKNKLKDSENQEKFKNILISSCDKVPNYAVECQEAITEYLPTLYANVDTLFNSTVICEKAGACLPRFNPLIRLPLTKM